MEQTDKIAIVIVAYNRPESLRRILSSLKDANYEGYSDIPLVISIDKSNSNEVALIAEAFEWIYGSKTVIAHTERQGLKAHIISCGDLTAQYDQVIVLEDDLYVSPFFYQYAQSALTAFSGDENIAGISLYAYDFNELARQPFIPLDDGYDNYFLQVPSSWGQMWSRQQWTGFKDFLRLHPEPLSNADKISNVIIDKWSESSWKKYFFKYMVLSNKFFVYPRISYTTNFGDIGAHYPEPTGSFQVNLNLGKARVNFASWEESLAKYDAYFEILPEVLAHFNARLKAFDFSVDLNGIKELEKINTLYLLSSKRSSAAEMSFAAHMIPHERNIIEGIDGDFFVLAKTKQFRNKRKKLNRFHAYNSKLNVHDLVDSSWVRMNLSFLYRQVRSLFGVK